MDRTTQQSIRLFAFDVDDVLVNTSLAEFKAITAALDRLDSSRSLVAVWHDVSIALPTAGIRPKLILLASELGVAAYPEAVAECEQIYWETFWQSQSAVEGAMELAESLPSKTIHVRICGNGLQPEQQRKLALAGFPRLIHQSGLAKFRPSRSAYALPNPFMLQQLRQSLGLTPEQCMFITCDTAGVVGANLDHWHSVLLDWERMTDSTALLLRAEANEVAAEGIASWVPSFQINSITELARALKR